MGSRRTRIFKTLRQGRSWQKAMNHTYQDFFFTAPLKIAEGVFSVSGIPVIEMKGC